MTKRRQTIEIFAPVAGFRSDVPAQEMDVRAQPRGQDARLQYGINQKEFGTSLYATGSQAVLNAPLIAVVEARFPASNVLEVLTSTGVYKYTSGLDGFVSDGQIFTGTTRDYWSSVLHLDAFLYSNGVDPIQIKSSFSATGTNMASALFGTTYKAWGLLGFREHLCLYHTVENGTEWNKRVRWTKKGVLNGAASTADFGSGTAGALDLPDAEGELKLGTPIGAGVAVFAERSVHLQYWVGGSEVFKFEKAVNGIGTPSRRGAVTYKDVAYFIGHNNFYAYPGGNETAEIGNPIKKAAFSIINNSALSNAFVTVDPVEDEILFHVPTGTSELPDTIFVYKINDDLWFPPLKRGYSSYGEFTRVSGLTIGELVGNIGDQNFTFGEAQVSVESLTRLYGDQSGRIVKVDPTRYSVSVSGTNAAQAFSYETPDLTGANIADPIDQDKVDFTSTNKRYLSLFVDALGSGTLAVDYSTDRGISFTALPESPLSLVTTGTNHQMDLDIDGKLARLRFTNTATNEFCGIKYVGLEFVPGSKQ